MSVKGYVLNVSPPFDGKDSEVHKYEGIDCPACGGTGKIKVFEDYLQQGEPVVDTCQRCSGSGKLRAKVVVKWEADTAIIE